MAKTLARLHHCNAVLDVVTFEGLHGGMPERNNGFYGFCSGILMDFYLLNLAEFYGSCLAFVKICLRICVESYAKCSHWKLGYAARPIPPTVI